MTAARSVTLGQQRNAHPAVAILHTNSETARLYQNTLVVVEGGGKLLPFPSAQADLRGSSHPIHLLSYPTMPPTNSIQQSNVVGRTTAVLLLLFMVGLTTTLWWALHPDSSTPSGQPWAILLLLTTTSSSSHPDTNRPSAPPLRGQEQRGLKQPPATSNTDANLPTVATVLQNFYTAQATYEEQLRSDYGLYTDALFHPPPSTGTATDAKTKGGVGKQGFLKGTSNAKIAYDRAKRKMMIRILEYLTTGVASDYVWATAGDSRAAGHGNFFDQQYTIVLQQQAAALFEAVGLHLIARPFAMHSSTSAPEIAACVREIYGSDVDLMVWDFALQDSRWHWRLEFFAHRAMLLPKHPALLVLQSGSDTERQATVEHLVEEGMAALRFDEYYANTLKQRIPDSRYNANIEELPDKVRYFRCGRAIEGGLDGGCAEHKFTKNGTCDDRQGRTMWHHGWKWHFLYGTMYSQFLMELIEDSLVDIEKHEHNTTGLLADLAALEKQEFEDFEASDNFKFAHRWDIDGTSLTTKLFYHHSVYCHTARLPAQTRYKGFVFDKERDDTWFDYKKGFSANRLKQNPEPTLKLSYASREQHNCSLPLHIDSLDFFLASPSFGDFQRISMPNTEEFKHYGPHRPQGMILICPAACTHKDCPGQRTITAVDINQGIDIVLQVNGERVAQAAPLDDCFLLQRENGDFQWQPNKAGRYDLGVHVLSTHRHFRISSIILW